MINAVIGLGFGDEGKGGVVDWLCSKSPKSVIRFSGGHQAGHNVIKDNISHIFSNFGSGTLRDCPTYWESQCPIDPCAIRREYNVLKSKGITPKLIIDNKSPITTPIEQYISRNDSIILNHGSCGTGIRKTQIREEAYYSLTAIDIKYIDILKIKFDLISRHFYKSKLCDELYDDFISACEWINSCDDITIKDITYDIIKTDYVYESSQGLLLDKNIGFFPHVTPSNVGMIYFRKYNIPLNEVFYVTRAYQTRHGNGPMTNEDIKYNISNSLVDTNPTNPYQGEFKKTMLDLNLLKYAIEKDGGLFDNSTLVITCLEHLTEYSYTDSGDAIFKYGDNAKLFCEHVGLELGFKKVVMCRDHKYEKMM